MHRVIQEHLEEVLAEATPAPAAAHLAECSECREEIAGMRQQASALRAFRLDEDAVAPRPGFYARVMERIEAQRPISIWQLFFDSAFGRRVAMASMGLALFFGVYLISSERYSDQPRTTVVIGMSDEDQPGMTLAQTGLPDKDTVLVNLVTYREQ
jgi:predicted anti-sigma-YlaC factor YlaD